MPVYSLEGPTSAYDSTVHSRLVPEIASEASVVLMMPSIKRAVIRPSGCLSESNGWSVNQEEGSVKVAVGRPTHRWFESVTDKQSQ